MAIKSLAVFVLLVAVISQTQAGCKDTYKRCSYYVERKYCTRTSYATWINKNCAKSCGKCSDSGSEPDTCEDTAYACGIYVQKGWCEDAKPIPGTMSHKEYMQNYCRASCDFCVYFRKMEEGHLCGKTWTPITSAETCDRAAKKLDLTYDNTKQGPAFPGCYHHNGVVAFNPSPTIAGLGFGSICENSAVFSKLKGVAVLSSQLARSTPASYCLDGNVHTFCGTLRDEKYPYIMMEYPQPVTVMEVKLQTRKDCNKYGRKCENDVKNVVVTVTDTKPTKGKLVSGGTTIGSKYEGPASSEEVITFKSGSEPKGKYVVVQRQDTGPLSLAEVEVKFSPGKDATEEYLIAVMSSVSKIKPSAFNGDNHFAGFEGKDTTENRLIEVMSTFSKIKPAAFNDDK